MSALRCISLSAVVASLLTWVFAPPRSALAQQAAASPSPSAGASVSGSPAIESTILEYETLAESAAYIDRALSGAVDFVANPKSRIIVATSSDVGAIVQLRAVLGQATLIKGRVDQLTAALKPIPNRSGSGSYYSATFPCFSPQKGVPSTLVRPSRGLMTPMMIPLAVGGAALQALGSGAGYAITNASGIQTLLQTIASIGAVNETVAPASGSLSDSSLINLIVLGLPGKSIFVPSFYAPGVLDNQFETGTLLGRSISALETSRSTLYAAADARVLSKACQAIATDSKGKPLFDKNQIPIRYNQATLNQIANEVTAASFLIDSFEASLFGGQPAPAPAPSPSASPAAAAAPASGTGLQQLLYADFLLMRLGVVNQTTVLDSNKGPTYLLGVHALESGGNTLMKSNLFAGSQVFFSGGAVSTFNLIKADGSPVCSGIGFGYRGFVPEDRMGQVVGDAQAPGAPRDSKDGQAQLVHFTSNCSGVH